MRLLHETSNSIEYLTEQTSTGKVLYLEGPMLLHSIENRNKRTYLKNVMEKAVDVYKRDFIDERRAIGELNHPNRPLPDPAEAAIMIEKLDDWNGNHVCGRARVLNTPKGQIIKALMEANYKMGVSSRGLGDVKERNGKSVVENFLLNAIDAVDLPSGHGCYVNSLQESTEWVNENGVWIQKPIIQESHSEENKETAFLNALDKLIESLKHDQRKYY